jgi:hypothetical protein
LIKVPEGCTPYGVRPRSTQPCITICPALPGFGGSFSQLTRILRTQFARSDVRVADASTPPIICGNPAVAPPKAKRHAVQTEPPALTPVFQASFTIIGPLGACALHVLPALRYLPEGFTPADPVSQIISPHEGCGDDQVGCLHAVCADAIPRESVASWPRLTPSVRAAIIARTLDSRAAPAPRASSSCFGLRPCPWPGRPAGRDH